MDLCKCCVLHVRLLTFTGLSVVPNKRCARRRHMVARMNSVWCPPSTSTIKASHKWHSGIADDLWVDFELCKCKYIQVQKFVKIYICKLNLVPVSCLKSWACTKILAMACATVLDVCISFNYSFSGIAVCFMVCYFVCRFDIAFSDLLFRFSCQMLLVFAICCSETRQTH